MNISDTNGIKLSVVHPTKDFKAIMEELDELEDIKRYNEALKCTEPSIPIDEVFKIIEAKRQEK